MTPQPLYRTTELTPAFALRYSWCGWITAGDLRSLSPAGWAALGLAWQKDGLHLLERAIDVDKILLTFSTKPVVSPVFLAARAKGRLEHALRAANNKGVTFSRKVMVRSVGDNVTHDVQSYIASQVQNEEFVDPRFGEFLKQFTIVDRSVDLSIPDESRSGRYWYNLHLVLVTVGRTRIVDEPSLKTIRDGSIRIAAKKGYRIASISVMPDHVHLAMRGVFEQSPEEIVLAFMNNLSHFLKLGAVWRPGYYVGTFGEYNMRAIREAARAESYSPARLAAKCQSKGVT